MWTGTEEFTKEQYLKLASLLNPGEKAPIYALLAMELGAISEDDIKWGMEIVERLKKEKTPVGR